jgi:hypothetical protein
MKKILVAAVLIATCAAVHAGDLAYASNQASGLIVLTDEPTGCASGQAYYSTDGYGQKGVFGCWVYSDPWIKTVDNDGVRHQYPANLFVITDYAKSKLPASKSSGSAL